MISRDRLKELQDENDTAFYGLDKYQVNELIFECTELIDELERIKESK